MHMRDSESSSMQNYQQPSRLVVLTFGLSKPIEDDKFAPFRAVHAKNDEDAWRILMEGGVAAFVLGARADLLQVLDFLERRAAEPSRNPPPTAIVLCAASSQRLCRSSLMPATSFTWPAEKSVRSSSVV
jgi:hypothetical protein